MGNTTLRTHKSSIASQLFVLFMVFAMILMPVPVSAAGGGEPAETPFPIAQCQDAGFDFAIKQYDWDDESYSENTEPGAPVWPQYYQNYYDIELTGDDESASWTAAPPVAGVVVLSESQSSTEAGGSAGDVDNTEFEVENIEHVIFCANRGDLVTVTPLCTAEDGTHAFEIESLYSSETGVNTFDYAWSITQGGSGSGSVTVAGEDSETFTTPAATEIKIQWSDYDFWQYIYVTPSDAPCRTDISEEPTERISAILECVVDNGDGSYTAHFGYENYNEQQVEIPVGPNNRFSGGGSSGEDRGQTTVFEYPAPNHPENREGRTGFYPDSEFTVDFDGSQLVWTLRGPDGQSRTATASSTSTACPVEVTPVEPLVLTSMCTYSDGGAQWRVRNENNDFDVPITWEIVNNQETGAHIATNGPKFGAGDTFFDSDLTGTMKIYWEDENGAQQQTTKATNPALCPEPEPTLVVYKYTCPEGTNFGPENEADSEGNFEAPEACTVAADVDFGYFFKENAGTGWVNPNAESDEFSFLGTTDENGMIEVFDQAPGQYDIAELEGGIQADDENMLYFACTFDNGTKSDNYEYTIVQDGETAYCVAYNLERQVEVSSAATICKEDYTSGDELAGWTLFMVELTQEQIDETPENFDASILALSQTSFDNLVANQSVTLYDTTGDSGCVTFDNLEAGTYAVGEVMQDGWQYVSGAGVFEVEGDETFTIVNKEKPVLPVCVPAEELIMNGGFEAPVVTASQGWDIFADGTTDLGWNVEWTTPGQTFQSTSQPEIANIELHAGVNGWNANEGYQYTELDSDWNGHTGTLNNEPSGARIFQTVGTEVGEEYTLSFAFSPRPGTSAANNEMDVEINGVVEYTIIADGTGNGNTVWEDHSVTFTATQPATEIAFVYKGTQNAQGAFLDSVSVVCDLPIVIAEEGTIEVEKVLNAPEGITTDDFSFFVNGTQIELDTQEVFAAGTWEVTETTTLDAELYEMETTFSGACDENGIIELENNQNAVCTVTNTVTEIVNVCELGAFHLDVGSSGESFLSVVDLTSGATSAYAQYDSQFRSAVAVSEDGIVYSMMRSGSNTGDLVTLNDDNTFTPVGATGLSGNTVAMSFAPDGTLYAMNQNTNGLYTVDTSTGAASLVHTFVPGVDGGDLVVNEYNYLIYVKANGNVYQVDLESGYATTLLGNLPSGSYTSAALVNGDYYAMDRTNDNLYSFELAPFSSAFVGNDGTISFGDATACPPEAKDRPELETSSTVLMCKADQFGNELEGWQLLLTGEDPVATVEVSPDGNVYSSASLPEGNYVVIAEGEYIYRPTAGARYSDAAFSQRLESDVMYQTVGPTFGTWVRIFGYTNHLTLQVNGAPVDWGMLFSQDHTYAYGTSHAGGEFDFQITDNQYNDNSGSIMVYIYEGHAGWTGQDGCFELADVEDGEYVVGEINHQDWDNISGLGPVTIDGDATITVVNENPDGGPTLTPQDEGSLQVVKYTCPAGTEIVRNSAAAPDENGQHTAPDECVLTEGVRFGVVHDETNNGTQGPFIGLDDNSTWSYIGTTDEDGTTLVGGLSTEGRHGVAELNESDEPVSHDQVIGFFCYGDPGTFTDNWDMTFIEDGQTSHCVMYNVEEGPGDGETQSTNGLMIHKYACDEEVTTTRGANGPAANGDHTVPADCEPLAGVEFGYIFQEGVLGSSGPYPGFSDEALFTSLGMTDENGQIEVQDLNSNGRYNIAEIGEDEKRLGDDDIIGFYCLGDQGASIDNYEFTFAPEEGFTHCVAYNKKVDEGPGDGETQEETTPGMLQVCKVIREDGMYVSDWSELPTTTFSMDVSVGGENFTWSIDTSTNETLSLIARVSGEDILGHCTVIEEVSDVGEGVQVLYDEEEITSGASWLAPLYNAWYNPGATAPFVNDAISLYGDHQRSIGSVFMTENNPDTTILIVNELSFEGTGQEDPFCVDTTFGYDREADEVISYEQGDRKNGGVVPAARSNPDSALTFTAGQDEQNFFSLGFGGEIVVRFNQPFVDGPGTDLIITEDTWGGNYPAETVDVFVSENGSDWTLIGVGNNDDQDVTHTQNEFDLLDAGLASAQYVKIVDTSNPAIHNNQADGFDINGIKALFVYEEVCDDLDTIALIPTPSDENDGEGGSSSSTTSVSERVQETSGSNRMMTCETHPWMVQCEDAQPQIQSVESEEPAPAPQSGSGVVESESSESDEEETTESTQTASIGPTGFASSIFDGVPSGAGALLALLLLLGLMGLGFAAVKKP